MTRKEASFYLSNIDRRTLEEETNEALDMTIKALEQELSEYAVDREQVNDILGHCIHSQEDYYLAIKMLNELPPVKQEPKTIQEKQAESEKYQKAYDDGYDNGYAQARFDYEQKSKAGHWIYDDECKEHGHCDICGFKTDLVDGNPHNYCRSCGARMAEGSDKK